MALVKALISAALLSPLLLQSCDEAPGDIALGVLAQERVALTATASEIVTELPVPEGETVTAGTVLVRLNDDKQRASVAVAEAEVARAEANLDKLKAGARPAEIAIARAQVDAARAAFTEAETTLNRHRQLLENNRTTQAQFEADLARRNRARAELRSAEEELRLLEEGAREEDLRSAEAQLAAAKAALQAERTRLSDLVIRASRGGVLDNLPWNLGERVTQGSPVAIILAQDVPFARVYVPEPARVRLSEDDRVTVRVDGRDAPLEGHVRWISAEPAFTPYYALNQENRSRLVYLAEIALPDSAAGLPVGLPVEVSLP